MTEIWKDVVGYEGLYQVSNLGRVRSLHRETHVMSTPRNKKDGYLRVNLKRNGGQKQCLVHRLVADAFIPNDEGLPQINHIDENKANNRLDNLERCSAKYNTNYGTHNERVAKTLGKRVLCVELDVVFDSAVAAVARLGFAKGSSTHINRCANGVEQRFAGYHWRYVEC